MAIRSLPKAVPNLKVQRPVENEEHPELCALACHSCKNGHVNLKKYSR